MLHQASRLGAGLFFHVSVHRQAKHSVWPFVVVLAGTSRASTKKATPSGVIRGSRACVVIVDFISLDIHDRFSCISKL